VRWLALCWPGDGRRCVVTILVEICVISVSAATAVSIATEHGARI
jgi:hypothetical protein